jgi:hypothetical protein
VLGFLGGTLDEVLSRSGIYTDKTRNRQAAGHAPLNPCMLRRLFATKETCGHKETCDCSYFIQISNAQL